MHVHLKSHSMFWRMNNVLFTHGQQYASLYAPAVTFCFEICTFEFGFAPLLRHIHLPVATAPSAKVHFALSKRFVSGSTCGPGSLLLSLPGQKKTLQCEAETSPRPK